MPRPMDLDTDPNLTRISWEVAVRVNPDTPFAASAAAVITDRITARTGVAPLSVTIDGAGTATIILPADRPIDQWVAWVAAELAGLPRPGVVTGIGDRARIT